MARRKNDGAAPAEPVIENGRLGDNAAKRLAGFVKEIEACEDRRNVLSEQIKDIYKAAKDAGFENKIIRKVIARRRREEDALQIEEDMIALYERALGEFVNTPLGQASAPRRESSVTSVQ